MKSLMELFFTNDTLTEEEIKKGIAKGIRTRGMFPDSVRFFKK